MLSLDVAIKNYEELAEENEKLKNGEVLVELQKKISQNIGGDLSSKGNNISSSNRT